MSQNQQIRFYVASVYPTKSYVLPRPDKPDGLLEYFYSQGITGDKIKICRDGQDFLDSVNDHEFLHPGEKAVSLETGRLEEIVEIITSSIPEIENATDPKITDLNAALMARSLTMRALRRES